MKTHTKNSICFIGLIISIFSINLISSCSAVVNSGEGTTSISGTLRAFDSERWSDNQYDFFQTKCNYNEIIQISLEYSGNVDLDLVIFVDEETLDENQIAYAWDIAHCGFDSKKHIPTGYSEKLGTDTNVIGLEIIYYANYDFEVARNVIILVFIQDEVGSADYNLTSTNEISAVSNYERCWTVIEAWGIFILGSVVIIILITKWSKKAVMTPEEKAAKAQEKLEKDQLKSKKGSSNKSGSTSSSMKARRGDYRR